MTTQKHNTTEQTMKTIIARYEELLKTRQAKDAQDAVSTLLREGVSFDDACTAARKAFGGKPARRTSDSITTTAW